MQSYLQTYQVIDGFGLFGAHDVWRGNAADMWDDAWGYPL